MTNIHHFRPLKGVKSNLPIVVVSQYPPPIARLKTPKGVIFAGKHQRKIMTIAWQFWDFARRLSQVIMHLLAV